MSKLGNSVIKTRSGACEHKFCREAGVLSASGMETNATAHILAMLLRPLSLIMLVGTVLFIGRDLVIGQPVSLVCLAALAVVGICALQLFRNRAMTMGQLRWIEASLFLAMAVQIVAIHHEGILAAAQGSDPGMALSAWDLSALGFVLLMTSYAIFIPNTWWRTATAVVPMALAPVLLGGEILFNHPATAARVEPVLNATILSDVGLLLMLGAAVAVMGSMLITRYRSTAFQAQEAGLYDLKQQIGAGGMGEVWLAEHQTLARPTAIKIIRPELIADGDTDAARLAVRRFALEAKATAALRSPNTIQIYDFGVTGDGSFYYVMEYLDGLNLDALVKQYGPLNAERAVHLLRQACASLQDAHASGLIHRDIKPANIYACRLGGEYDFVKVLDFGLVKDQQRHDGQTQLTVDGLTTGTPAFMAPEMAMQSDAVSPATDVYALGCVAYWLLTGKFVFDQPTPMAMVVDHVKTQPVPPSQRTELPIPAELEAIVLKCLQKAPQDRYASMRELSDALAAVPFARVWNNQAAEDWWHLHQPEGELEVLQKAS